MKIKRMAALAMSLALAGAMTGSAFAADITTDGGNASVPIQLTVGDGSGSGGEGGGGTNFSVTVPTSLPVNMAADGTVTTATDAKIVNNSGGPVKVANMTIAGANGWTIEDYDSFDATTTAANTKKFAMKINGDKTTGTDTISFTESNFPQIAGKNNTDSDELAINYDAKVPAQTTDLSDVNIANVVFTVGWDTVA